MSDLQEHINKWESWLASAHGCDFDHDTMQAILHVNEAARRVANLDLMAGARGLYEANVARNTANGENPSPWPSWDGISGVEQDWWYILSTPAVNAALGITEE